MMFSYTSSLDFQEIALQPVCDDFDRGELNHLLSYACARLEEKVMVRYPNFRIFIIFLFIAENFSCQLPINSYSWNPLNNPAHTTPFTTDRCAALQKKL